MHTHDQCTQIGDQLGKGFAEGFPSSDQHIVMLRDKVTRACCHSGAKATFYAIALGGIAGFLGNREADAGFGLCCRDGPNAERPARLPRAAR